MSALVRAFSNFAQAISNIAFAVLNAGLAVFNAVVLLGKEIVSAVFDILQAVVQLFTELLQDTIGFIFGERFHLLWQTGANVNGVSCLANFFLLLVLGGAYYLYTNYSSSSRSKGKRRA